MLLELEMKNAWLSVDGLNPMPMLTKLTLEFIRLEDEDLNKVNDYFPCLQVLNLVGVGALKQPKIHLLHPNTCLWTVSTTSLSLAIYAPSLMKLELKCIKPISLVLENPLFYDFSLSTEKAKQVRIKEFQNLKNLQLEYSSLCKLIDSFPLGSTIKKLKVDLRKSVEHTETRRFGLGKLFYKFPNLSSLNLGPSLWSQVESHFRQEGLEREPRMKYLTEIIAHLVVDDVNVTFSFILCILNTWPNLSEMALLIHCEVDSGIGNELILRCTVDHPRVSWRLGM